MKRILTIFALLLAFVLKAQEPVSQGNLNRRFDYEGPVRFKQLVLLPEPKSVSLFPATNCIGALSYESGTKLLKVWNGAAWVLPWDGMFVDNVQAIAGQTTVGTSGNSRTIGIDPAYTTARNAYSDNAIATAVAALNLDGTPDTSARKAVSVGTAPASAAAGKISYFNTFYTVPGTSNTVSWKPGFSISDGTKTMPLFLNGRLILSARYEGDSFTRGFGLASSGDSWVDKLSNMFGWSWTNNAVNGTTIANRYRGLAQTASEVVIIGFGQNDCRLYGLAALASYQNLYMGYMLSFYGPTAAQAWSKATPSDWTTTSIDYVTTTGSKTTVNNSPATLNVTGDVVYVSVAYEVNADVMYTISIDGVSQGSFTANSAILAGYPNPATTNDNVNYYPYLHRFSGLSRGVHEISVQKISGTYPLRLISGMGNGNLKPAFGNNAVNIYAWGPAYQAAGSTYSGNIAGLNDSMFDAYNDGLNNVCSTLAFDGLQVEYVDIRPVYNPNEAGSVQADLLHPSATGNTKILTAWIEKFSIYKNKSNQLLQALLTSVRSNTNFIPKFNGQILGKSILYADNNGIGINSTNIDRGINIGYNASNAIYNGIRIDLNAGRTKWFETYSNPGIYVIGTSATVSGNRDQLTIAGSQINFAPYDITTASVMNDRFIHNVAFTNTVTYSNSTGAQYGLAFYNSTINQSGSASYRFLQNYFYLQNPGAGGAYFVDLQRSTLPNGGGTLTDLLRGDISTGNIYISGQVKGGQNATAANDLVNLAQLRQYAASSTSVSANYTTGTAKVIKATGTITVTLAITGIDDGFEYTIANVGSGTVTVVVSGGGTISGASSKTYTVSGTGGRFVKDGSNYILTGSF